METHTFHSQEGTYYYLSNEKHFCYNKLRCEMIFSFPAGITVWFWLKQSGSADTNHRAYYIVTGADHPAGWGYAVSFDSAVYIIGTVKCLQNTFPIFFITKEIASRFQDTSVFKEFKSFSN